MINLLFYVVYLQANTLDEGQVDLLANNQTWLKLLHYENKKSQIESVDFFLDSNGKTDFKAEIIKNLLAFNNDKDYSCRFPARAHFFSTVLNKVEKKCQHVESWKQLIQAESVALVYVTQYVSNPASVFGHSFLLFENSKRPISLNVAFNNAAMIPENVSAYDYATKGLFGGFPAIYTMEPFYLKIQDYNNIENRDLWIYQLNLTPLQIDQLLNHLWELSNLKSEQYYFLTKNCGFNIYNSLAAVNNDLKFISENSLYVLPIETIKKVKPLTKNIIYYPSLYEKLHQKTKNLELSQNLEVDKAEIDLDLFEFKKSQNTGKLSDLDLIKYDQALLHRAKLGQKLNAFIFLNPEYPDNSHETWRTALGLETKDDQNILSFSISPFYHSFMQNNAGFLPNSEIIILDFLFKKPTFDQVYLNQLTLLKMSNFLQSTSFYDQYSWQFETKISNLNNERYFFNGNIDIGKSKYFFEDHLFYVLAGFNLDQDQVLYPEIKSGMLSQFNKIRIKTEVKKLFDKKINNYYLELSANDSLIKNIDLEFKYVFNEKDSVSYLNLNYFF